MAAQCDVYPSAVRERLELYPQSYRRSCRGIVKGGKLVGLAPGDVPASHRVSKERVAKPGARTCWIGLPVMR